MFADQLIQIPCFTTAIGSSGCGASDYRCQCTTGNAKIAASITSCAPTRCSAEDVLSKYTQDPQRLDAILTQSAEIAPAAAGICQAAGYPLASASAAAASSAAAGTSAAPMSSMAASAARSSSMMMSQSAAASSMTRPASSGTAAAAASSVSRAASSAPVQATGAAAGGFVNGALVVAMGVLAL
jgi:hypothetical protein